MDAYAQDLHRRLFRLAYPQAQRGTEEAGDIGRSVLSCHFVARLRQDIKIKLAGVEETIEQQFAKARLEGAKLRDFSERMPGPLPPSHTSTPMLVTHTKAGGDEGGDDNRE